MSCVSDENLLRVKTVADKGGCTPKAIYDAIGAGRIKAVRIDGITFIAEDEATRFIETWPTNNRGVSNRWKEYRQWKAATRSHEAAA
jgi:hypothetical protein